MINQGNARGGRLTDKDERKERDLQVLRKYRSGLPLCYVPWHLKTPFSHQSGAIPAIRNSDFWGHSNAKRQGVASGAIAARSASISTGIDRGAILLCDLCRLTLNTGAICWHPSADACVCSYLEALIERPSHLLPQAAGRIFSQVCSPPSLPDGGRLSFEHSHRHMEINLTNIFGKKGRGNYGGWQPVDGSDVLLVI